MTRLDIINLICARIRARKYLEIGISKGQTLSAVIAPDKRGVDPAPRLDELGSDFFDGLRHAKLHIVESDAFFAADDNTYDVVFVDGLHIYEQAMKDILNALNRLNPGGYVVVHDLLPEKEEEAARERHTYMWNGDVWKVMFDIYRNHPEIDGFVVDDDLGVGVLWAATGARFTPAWDPRVVALPFVVYETFRHRFMDIVEPSPRAVLSRLMKREAAAKRQAA